MEENFLQGDEEKLLGLPVSPLNDREKATMSYSQIGFIEYLVAPFLLTVTKAQGVDAVVMQWCQVVFAKCRLGCRTPGAAACGGYADADDVKLEELAQTLGGVEWCRRRLCLGPPWSPQKRDKVLEREGKYMRVLQIE